jgi:hypothetical protein
MMMEAILPPELLDRTLFYRHVDHILGHIPPAYSPCYTALTGGANVCPNDDIGVEDMTIRPLAARAAKCELALTSWVHIVAISKAHVQSNLFLFYQTHIELWGGVLVDR